MDDRFRVGVTRDFLNPDGEIGWGDIGLGELEARPGVEWEFIAADGPYLPPGSLAGYDALLSLTPRIDAASLRGADRLRIISRFGVGYDMLDVEACTAAGVAVSITPDGVRRPVAVAALMMMLAVGHRVRQKDALVRTGGWFDRLDHMGSGVTGRTLGLVGWGNIGREITRLTAPLEMDQFAFDPYADKAAAEAAGVRLGGLDEVLAASDFVIVSCALTPETRHLLNAGRFAVMKPTAFLVNVARGGVVDQPALTDALLDGVIAGAALDVFEEEPIAPDDRLLALENVLLAPHSIAWTDEFARRTGTAAIEAILAVADGRAPRTLVDRKVLDHPAFRR
ncbi:NAD(P)-dependent oxidoreductase [Actinomadura roseirufa]|uniref:NAD(P)-dependent oxidoreductase n=1 Tax=Actinomadura roseirufa TaxID=2094049 RepID=UPI0010416513|nr:NAD(P)-dependent oxidoreductase [Actinomadura roseirufa]